MSNKKSVLIHINTNQDKITFFKGRIEELEKYIVKSHMSIEKTTDTIQKYRNEIHELWKAGQK